ncbi:MAG TPA: hypothetical protein VNZ64_06215 [Candidatus Acidoferrum sp.]|jgi:hypothetical protein|nr:hypothetical protein [Candidatus Acidoferrum sp.]
MKTKKQPEILPNINQSMSARRRSPTTFIYAITIILTFLAMRGKAGNILVNPGFDTTLFAPGGWTQHAGQTWMENHATAEDHNSIKLIRTGADSLWMQGQYNGVNQDSYVSQTFATFPGNVYSADAWYSTYTYEATNRLGGATAQTLGTTTYYTGLFGPAGGANGAQADGWVEVKFFDSGNNLIADYRSMIVDPAFVGFSTETTVPFDTYTGTLPTTTNAIGNIYLNWIDMPVTNQYDISKITPNTEPDVEIANSAITNTLGAGQNIVAPPGAAKVEFGIHFFQSGNNPDGTPFWDDATLNQIAGPSPSIITPTPDGTEFFNAASTNFTFKVVSASTGGAPLPTNSTSRIGITVNGVNQTGNLQFSGASTNLSVTLSGLLASNSPLYTMSISVTNSVGLVSSKTVSFDTFPTNVFIVSAEDYDYTNGLFIQNPTPTSAPAANSYFGTAGVLGVDLSTYGGTGVLPGNGAAQLIRLDGHSAEQKAADIQLPQYAAANDPNVYNVQIAYNNGGNWFNYTRNYPTGNYLLYLRYNNGNAGNVESLNLLTSGYGTSTQTTTNLGVFIGANTGAGYAWVPLTDTFGNRIIVNLPAAQNTLQLLSGNGAGAGGIANFVDIIFVPSGTSFPPIINNLSPNYVNPPVNAGIFLTNITNISFSVSSTFSTVATNSIHTVINGVDVSSSVSYSGYNTNWNASLPCPQNQLITLVVTATDANALSNSVSETFDTFSQDNLMIEAEDFDFNAGQFIDDPIPTYLVATATNSYYAGGVYGTNAAVFNVDYDGTYDGEALAGYRDMDKGVKCEICSDFVRAKFSDNGSTDLDVGYWNGGQWLNYTRTFPTNNYNVYGRLAGGNGPFNNTTLKLVTAGRGTTTQTTQLLGSFADANAAGWQTWHWVPMRDTNGNLVTVSLGGVQTVQATSGNNLNANFYMFVPTVSAVKLSATLSGYSLLFHFPTVTGHNYTVLYNNTLVGGTWQPLSATIPGDGTVQTVTDTVAGTRKFYRLQIQ